LPFSPCRGEVLPALFTPIEALAKIIPLEEVEDFKQDFLFFEIPEGSSLEDAPINNFIFYPQRFSYLNLDVKGLFPTNPNAMVCALSILIVLVFLISLLVLSESPPII
jgi:hypothetical protein